MLKHTQHAKKTGRFGSTCQYFVVLDSVFHKWAVTSTEPQVLQVAIKICRGRRFEETFSVYIFATSGGLHSNDQGSVENEPILMIFSGE